MTDSRLASDVADRHFRLWLIGIVMSCMLLAATWALRIPIFQEPDEIAHLDYAFALYDAGRPFRVRDAIPATEVTAQIRYLSLASGYRLMRYNPSARVPAGYGTRSFIAGVDKAAPPPSHRVPRSGGRLPYVMFVYPIGYYAIVATAMSLAGALSHGSLVAQVLAARLVNVVFLGITLALAAAILRALRVSAATTLIAILSIGAFPLAGSVAGYVQPDNLSLLLLTATLYVALRWRKRPYSLRLAGWLGLVLSALFTTKQQYGMIGWIASAALILSYCYARVSLRTLLANVTLALVVPLTVVSVSLLFWPVETVSVHPRLLPPALLTGYGRGPGAFTKIAVELLSSFQDAYAGGNVFVEYWFHFGIRGGTVFSQSVVRIVQYPIIILTLAAVVTLYFVQVRVLRRLVTIARGRSLALACRLFSSGIALNMYVATTLMLFTIRILTHDFLVLAGRYWLPVIVPAFVILLVIVPRFAAKRLQQKTTRIIACTFALYSVVASLSALSAIGPSYYGTKEVPRREFFADIGDIVVGDERVQNPHALIKVPEAARITVSGYAVDALTGYPARRVVLELDRRRRYYAHTGQPSLSVARIWNDDAIRASGFSVNLMPGVIQRGKHRLAFSVESGNVTLPFGPVLDVESAARER